MTATPFRFLLSCLFVPLRQSFHISSSFQRLKAAAHHSPSPNSRLFNPRSSRYRYLSSSSSSSWRKMQMQMQNGDQQEYKTAVNVDVDVDDAERSSRTRSCYAVCSHCKGEGKLSLGLTKKQKLRHKREKNNAMNNNETAPTATASSSSSSAPRRVLGCHVCHGTGVLESKSTSGTVPDIDPRLPELAIIGGGIGGLALATACRHRGIAHTVYERDHHFAQRSQGYGLTMQQASKALAAFGIDVYHAESDGITSTKHVVHKQDGTVVGEWGLRKWGRDATKDPKRQNIHIARQSLRYELLQTATAAGGCTEPDHGTSTSTGTGGTNDSNIQWNHKLLDFETCRDHVRMTFQVGDAVVERRADLIVGADGFRSVVRQALIGDEMRYLGCIVILGICDLTALLALVPSMLSKEALELLDGETVFQTADGTTRIYMMPYSSTEYMWQLSFPMDEQEATALSQQGPQALKEQAIARCQSWHTPVPQILRDTPASLVSGYPVYDRALLTAEMLDKEEGTDGNGPGSGRGFSRRVILIGDASHPMSPFKGQGANQALLDALNLARSLYQSVSTSARTSNHHNHTPATAAATETPERASVSASVSGAEDTSSHAWKDAVFRFEEEMLARSAVKVQASAEAAQFLHTDVAIQEGNVTRGVAAAAATSSAAAAAAAAAANCKNQNIVRNDDSSADQSRSVKPS